MLAAASMLLLLPVVALSGQIANFHETSPAQRSRAVFPHAEREQLLADAYACNRAAVTGEHREECASRERAAQQLIIDRIQSNHRQADAARQEMRRIRNMHSTGK